MIRRRGLIVKLSSSKIQCEILLIQTIVKNLANSAAKQQPAGRLPRAAKVFDSINGYTPLRDAAWHGFAESAEIVVDAGVPEYH